MKSHKSNFLLSTFAVVGAGLSLSGCTNAPALSQPTQAPSSYLKSKKGQRCQVAYRLTDDKTSYANGIIKDVNDQWVVVDNVTERVLTLDSKQKDVTSDYYIAKQSVIFISFSKR